MTCRDLTHVTLQSIALNNRMQRQGHIQNLEKAIAIVERIHGQALADAPMPSDGWNDRAGMERHHVAGREAVETIVRDGRAAGLGGSHRTSGDTRRLYVSGLAATCTSSDWGLIGNWLTAARRKVERLKLEGEQS